jgi:hypothetical protein
MYCSCLEVQTKMMDTAIAAILVRRNTRKHK